MQTVIGINGALAEIKSRGWDQVRDSNGETILVTDIDLDPNADDLEREYFVDADTVTLMRDGYRDRVVWTHVACTDQIK